MRKETAGHVRVREMTMFDEYPMSIGVLLVVLD